MGCLHKEYERTRSFSRGAKTPGGKEPTWRSRLSRAGIARHDDFDLFKMLSRVFDLLP
jgi:hypothetical protein